MAIANSLLFIVDCEDEGVLILPIPSNEYALLKKAVAKACNNDAEKYCSGKNNFVQHHEKLALSWYKLKQS